VKSEMNILMASSFLNFRKHEQQLAESAIFVLKSAPALGFKIGRAKSRRHLDIRDFTLVSTPSPSIPLPRGEREAKPLPLDGGEVGERVVLKQPRYLMAELMLLIVFSFILLPAAFAQTATPAMPPAIPEIEARLKKLETELRCLVCQNQTLAESPAGLAGDLRREIRLLADSGKSNEEIKEFVRVRYGDFVLYNPPMSGRTYLLWFGPFALLAGGALIAFLMARQRRLKLGVVQPPMSEAEQKRADALLKGDDDKPKLREEK
jgi:cytochrome c-type biogenesis protein CcmH